MASGDNKSDSTSWFRSAVIYQILVDRFAGADPEKAKQPVFAGGTVRGIIDKLDYLQDLGVNTLWLSPIYQGNAFHGYHITDFMKVDPHFGDVAEVQELITECHSRTMKIIVDFVPNHCSYSHMFFLDAQNRELSIYRDWFFFKKWPDEYLCFLHFKEIPKINLDDISARDYMIKTAKYWLGLGFDGFRLDHVLGPSHSFWKAFRDAIKKDFPSAVLIGEAWMMGIKFKELETINVRGKYRKWLLGADSDSLLKAYTKELDGVLDFKFQELVRKHIAESDDPQRRDILKAELAKHYKTFPENYFLPAFLDNHDMDRFMFSCNNDRERFKEAVDVLFSVKQPVIIYYGDEQGLSQEKSMHEVGDYGDLQVRQPIDWDHQDKDMLDFFKKTIKQTRNISSDNHPKHF